jgi:hypothetical protein
VVALVLGNVAEPRNIVLEDMENTVGGDDDRRRAHGQRQASMTRYDPDGRNAPDRRGGIESTHPETVPQNDATREKADASRHLRGNARKGIASVLQGYHYKESGSHRNEPVGVGARRMTAPAPLETDSGAECQCNDEAEGKVKVGHGEDRFGLLLGIPVFAAINAAQWNLRIGVAFRFGIAAGARRQRPGGRLWDDEARLFRDRRKVHPFFMTFPVHCLSGAGRQMPGKDRDNNSPTASHGFPRYGIEP